jgi:DNA helicase-2/ATP-dependent DNA helicase PcrA
MLRIVENPFDEVCWFRTLTLVEGVGPATARRLIEELGVRGANGGAGSPIARLNDHPPSVSIESRSELLSLGQALADCAAGSVDLPPVATQLERIRRHLEPIINRRYSSPVSRIRDLEQLELLAAEAPSRARFLTDLTLDPPHSTGDLASPPHLYEDYLILSTIHSAKGLEWHAVHVLALYDGNFPACLSAGSTETIDEERRLLYVAMTRARRQLHLYVPVRYYHRPRGRDDAHGYGLASRFLTAAAQALCEPVRQGDDHAWSRPLDADAPKIHVDLDDLWR